MIKAFMFDLDGTLVQTEKLKALSYAVAVQHLLGLSQPDHRAMQAYREVVGVSRDIASQYIVDKLELTHELLPLMAQYRVSQPGEVLTAMRTTIYDDMVADPNILRKNQWPHTVELLHVAKEATCKTALVTMSRRSEVLHVLNSIGIERLLDLIITAEDIRRGKPDPEGYILAANKLQVEPHECLVLEDSVNGVLAAQAAGMNVIAIATPFTSATLHSEKIIEHAWIVHEPEKLAEMVQQRIEEHTYTAHGG
jgi:beta-phosphoglucomutase